MAAHGLTATWNDAWLLDGVRTPFADYNGALAQVSPIDLGIKAAREVFARSGASAADVGTVITGSMAQASFDTFLTPPKEDDKPAHRMLKHWAETGTSPWAAGYDAVKYGGSLQRAIKAAGGDGWFPNLIDATPQAVAHAKSLGLKVGAWTVDDPADMTRLIELGLDGICTDRPDLLAKTLKAARPTP